MTMVAAATMAKFRSIEPMNTSRTTDANVEAVGALRIAARQEPHRERAASENVTKIAVLPSTRMDERRDTRPSTSDDAAPSATAGAGPSSAMASTRARKQPETRTPRTSSATASLPTASTSNSPTSAPGCQSAE